MMRFTDVKEVKTIYQVSVAETKTSPQTFRCLRSNSWNKRRDLCTKKMSIKTTASSVVVLWANVSWRGSP